MAGNCRPWIVWAAAASDRLAPTARELGLQPVGGLPLMVLRPDGPPVEPSDTGWYQVDRVTTPEDLAVVHHLQAAAFGLPLNSIARILDQRLLALPDTSVFLTRREGQPVSTVTTTGASEVVGIWSMATPPEHQRQGVGRATLEFAMAHHRARGGRLFYLGASPAGKPLYDHVGFQTVEETPIWVAGQSMQFPAH